MKSLQKYLTLYNDEQFVNSMKIKNLFLSNSLKYVFNILAVAILIISFLSMDIFQTTTQKVLQISTDASLRYTQQIASNMAKEIKEALEKDFYKRIKRHPSLQLQVEHFLRLFVTDKYKYIYLVDKKSQETSHYRFLADGSVEDKSSFGEVYMPLDTKKWEHIYKTHMAEYFTHKDIEDVWMTYLQPIIVDKKVEAILVIDFSMAEQHKMEETMKVLGKLSNNAFFLFSIIFLLVLFFSYVDGKRERAKEKSFEKIQELNARLEIDVQNAINETKKTEKLLQQQTRLAQMGEMISMIAHQWRQPLSSISSAALSIRIKIEMQQVNFSDEEQKQKFLDFTLKKVSNIGEYTQVLSSTIDDFRNFFKGQDNKELLSIMQPIEKAFSIVEAALTNNNIELIKDFQDTRELYINQNEVMQVLLNIIKNAEDNLKEKEITNGFIKVSTYREDNRLYIVICDNGGGIDEAIIDKIFDPYFSTKKEKNGTGLGLYMSKIIIEEHNGGNLYVENKNGGACFTIVWNNENQTNK
jgi:signal transduction histidine kinase